MQITRTLRKGPWTLDEERRLVILVNQFGAVGSWQQISSLLGSRNAHQSIRRPFPPIPQNYAHPTSLAPHSYTEIGNIIL
ncbi:10243_t:CDS:2 [Rhizophagus irregularis]|nr:10243_t:CDS:2 [Rhizophagus irregularis]